MINFKKMWKTMNNTITNTRNIKEVEYNTINLNEYILIDVRSRREFSESHLNGAINIPLPEIKRNIGRYVQNKNKKILLYCEYGGRSAKAVEILNKLGYTNAYNLKGGLEKI